MQEGKVAVSRDRATALQPGQQEQNTVRKERVKGGREGRRERRKGGREERKEGRKS